MEKEEAKEESYMSKREKLRPLGEILLEVEPLILEMVTQHDLQHGDILYLIKGYLDVHCPAAREIYEEDGSSPTLKYGPNNE